MFGEIKNPFGPAGFGVASYVDDGTPGAGLIVMLGNFVRMLIVLASLYAFWNLLMAGWGFLNAGGDSKAVLKSWDKIWQSLMGLLLVAGSFVLAGIFGWLIFRDALALLRFRIFTP